MQFYLCWSKLQCLLSCGSNSKKKLISKEKNRWQISAAATILQVQSRANEKNCDWKRLHCDILESGFKIDGVQEGNWKKMLRGKYWKRLWKNLKLRIKFFQAFYCEKKLSLSTNLHSCYDQTKFLKSISFPKTIRAYKINSAA